jgi:hypothetical protein
LKISVFFFAFALLLAKVRLFEGTLARNKKLQCCSQDHFNCKVSECHDKRFKEFLFDQVFTENNSGMND